MNFMHFPRGDARAIANARAKGLKPAGAVEIVLAGDRFDSANPVVFADQDRIYRWDWVSGLNVVLLIDSKTRLDRILADIDRANPEQIDVIDRERRLGWLITCTKPRIRTVRWPTAWVADWLDGQAWHQELAKTKADAIQAANAKQAANPVSESEAIWN